MIAALLAMLYLRQLKLKINIKQINKEGVNMFNYKRVKIDSKQAIILQQKGYRIVNIDVFNGYILFEIKI